MQHAGLFFLLFKIMRYNTDGLFHFAYKMYSFNKLAEGDALLEHLCLSTRETPLQASQQKNLQNHQDLPS
ncbi:hypothetical protein GDO81_004261 [Engystomops pustulosus]|uniref:Uncharacterized protein n=1 Tax=Engystomops pustulosus TaxID=76066 RepID=A0AAV6ZWX6_ENGPU|nr:hypothetical protein GDO81_004261 [Engystomops pustulosus]